jgi:hypothetical protein
MLALNSLKHHYLSVEDCSNINSIKFDHNECDTLSKDQVKWMAIPSSYCAYNKYDIKYALKESKLIRVFD